MNHRGISHTGLSTLELDETRVLRGCFKEGGSRRHLFFDIGRDQLIPFLEPNGVPDVPASYDAGITSDGWYVRAEGRFFVPAH